MRTKFQTEDTINMLECIHVSLCTDDLTSFNHSLSVNPVLHVLVCVDVCVCVCVCVCMREREFKNINNNKNNLTL